MKFLYKILTSTPLLIVYGTTILVSVFVLPFYFTWIVGYFIGEYIHIFISIIFVLIVALFMWKYKKYRKPRIIEHSLTTDSEKLLNFKCAKLWKEESTYVLVFGIFVSTITVANYWIGLVVAPIILILYGSFCIVALKLMEKGTINVSQLKSAASNLPSTVKSPMFSQTLVSYFIVLVLASGYWAFQIQKNESQLKQDGYSLVNELSELAYCQNSQTQCVAVDNISRVGFEKIDSVDGPGKVWQICFSLNYAYSKYGNFYESDYRLDDYCFINNEYASGWPQLEMEDEIYKYLRQEINW